MPLIETIDGLKIYIYNHDHMPPHIHVYYNEFHLIMIIESGIFLNGRLPVNKIRLVTKWLNNNAARVLRYFLSIKSKFEMRKRIQSPRILKINWIDELIVSVVFNNGESRVINFSTVFDQICVNEESPAYILRDPEEFAKMELEGYTLSWENASQIIMGLDGKSRQVPFEIGPDTLYDFSQPDVTSVGLNIGYEIRRSRLASGMTQQDLANKSGTTRNYISRIENNHSDIEMGTLRKIIEIGLGRKLDIQIR